MENEKESLPSRSAVASLDLGFLALVGFIMAVPLLYEGTTDVHRARAILASLPFLAHSTVSLWREGLGIAFERLAKVGVALVLAGLVLSAVFADRQVIAWLRVLELVWAILLVVFVGRRVAREPREAIWLLVAFAAAYTLSNVRLLLDWMLTEGDPRARDWSFSIPGYFHYRNLGFAAAPALLALAWLPFSKWISEYEGRGRLFAFATIWAAAFLGWAVMGWSGTRAGYLSAVVGIVAVLIYGRKQLPVMKTVAFSGSAAVLGSLSSIPFTPNEGSFGIMRILGRAAPTSGSGNIDEYSSGRIKIWLDGFERWRDNWILGIGPDQYASQPALPSRLLEPHNAVVDVALEAGLIGLIGLVFIVWVLFRSMGCIRNRAASIPVVGCVFLFGVFSMIDGTLVWTLPLVTIAITLGIFFGLASKSQSVSSTAGSRGLVVVAGLVACLSIVGFGSVLYQASELKYTAPKPDSTAARFIYNFPATTWGLSAWLAEWDKSGVANVEDWHRMLIQKSPAPHFYKIEYAYFLIRKGRLPEANHQLAEALEIAPISMQKRLKQKHGPVLEQLAAALAQGVGR